MQFVALSIIEFSKEIEIPSQLLILDFWDLFSLRWDLASRGTLAGIAENSELAGRHNNTTRNVDRAELRGEATQFAAFFHLVSRSQ